MACNPDMGTGHLQRCLTLASELKDRNISVNVITDENTLAREIGSKYGGDVEYVASSTLIPGTVGTFRVLVIDVAPNFDSFLEKTKNLTHLAELNDDGVSIVSIGHVTKNLNYFRAVIDLYPSREIHSANYHEGPDFLILRREFEKAPVERDQENIVLISMGGSDPHNLTHTALMTLENGGFSGLAKVVLGVGYPEKTKHKLQQLIETLSFQVKTLHNVKDMRNLMRQSFIGMAAFGTTAYEMMSQRLPIMVFTHYRWQEPSARLFEDMGCCKYLGCAEASIAPSEFGKIVKEFIKDKSRLRSMGDRSRATVDGKGAKRVADMIEHMANEKDGLQLDVLFILAHPGDELFGCGGTLLRHIEKGDRVGLVILGEGVSSRRTELDGASSIMTARHEIRSSLQTVVDRINLQTWYYYRFEDNRFDKHDLLDIIKVVEAVLKRHRPHTVYTHHSGDLNIDHRRTFEAVVTAVRPSSNQSVMRLFSVEVPSSSDWGGMLQKDVFLPNWFVDVSDVLEQKIELIKNYDSELRNDPHPRSISSIRERARYWGRVSGRSAAEAYVLQRAIND